MKKIKRFYSGGNCSTYTYKEYYYWQGTCDICDKEQVVTNNCSTKKEKVVNVLQQWVNSLFYCQGKGNSWTTQAHPPSLRLASNWLPNKEQTEFFPRCILKKDMEEALFSPSVAPGWKIRRDSSWRLSCRAVTLQGRERVGGGGVAVCTMIAMNIYV
jgi:hypothetical protein